ncbi:MAG: YfdQ family protein [Ideonella sp.]|jgi:uncharacterized protein YfdQ (DUF2303 family)|nr:YfdQ family protein [Ideonella sp.]
MTTQNLPAAPVTTPNLAETLARELPKPHVVLESATGFDSLSISHVAVPKNFELKEVKVDLESMMAHPRRTKATATFSDLTSFLAYVNRHAVDDETAVWCDFNPQTFALSFTAVIDEHSPHAAGWRAHRAEFKPDMSAEWKAWKGKDRAAMSQIDFAEWIQNHEDDITKANGLPSSLEMLEMATNFVMHEEHAFKSAVRLQSGGFRLNYIADPDQGTVEQMQLFERFAIGIPVFQGVKEAWSITARLKYRNPGGKLSFFYELVRPDRVHEAAALELIGKVREGVGAIPFLLGSCN